MDILSTPNQYLYELQTTSPAEAKRLWRRKIKEKWDYECAYCGSDTDLTIDHVVPRSKGGADFTKNVVCCCSSCNGNKGHQSWEEWYFSQDFFDKDRYDRIKEWMKPEQENLFLYRPRRNNCT